MSRWQNPALMRSGLLFFLAVVVLVITGTPSAVAYGVRSPVPAIPSSPILHVAAESTYPVEPIKFALETRIGLFASGDPVNNLDPDGRLATGIGKGAVLGDYYQPKNFAQGLGQFVGQTGVSFVPWAGQAADVRDFSAAVGSVRSEGLNWRTGTSLAVGVVAFVPGIGDVAKGIAKPFVSSIPASSSVRAISSAANLPSSHAVQEVSQNFVPLAAKTVAPRNPNVYEAFFEAPITGTSRSAHRASANQYFANQLGQNADLAAAFNRELGTDVLSHMQSGKSLLNPPGMVWHHPANNPSVMQLLRTGEHTNPSLQSILHPNGVGGFGNFYGP